MRSVSPDDRSSRKARPVAPSSLTLSQFLRQTPHLGGHDVSKLRLLAGLALGALREDGDRGLHRLVGKKQRERRSSECFSGGGGGGSSGVVAAVAASLCFSGSRGTTRERSRGEEQEEQARRSERTSCARGKKTNEKVKKAKDEQTLESHFFFSLLSPTSLFQRQPARIFAFSLSQLCPSAQLFFRARGCRPKR